LQNKEEVKTVIWKGSAIVQLSESTIATMDQPNKKRLSVRFSFIIHPKKSIDIYDHRDRSVLSSRIYFENINIMKIDINRRATATVKRREDGTEYIVLSDISENIPITYALQEIQFGDPSAEWSSPPNKETMFLIARRHKDDP